MEEGYPRSRWSSTAYQDRSFTFEMEAAAGQLLAEEGVGRGQGRDHPRQGRHGPARSPPSRSARSPRSKIGRSQLLIRSRRPAAMIRKGDRPDSMGLCRSWAEEGRYGQGWKAYPRRPRGHRSREGSTGSDEALALPEGSARKGEVRRGTVEIFHESRGVRPPVTPTRWVRGGGLQFSPTAPGPTHWVRVACVFCRVAAKGPRRGNGRPAPDIRRGRREPAVYLMDADPRDLRARSTSNRWHRDAGHELPARRLPRVEGARALAALMTES